MNKRDRVSILKVGAICRYLLGSFCTLVVLNACVLTSAATTKLTPVTVQLSWTHQAQFAGFYAADQEGYYAAEGLAVSFLQGGPTTAPIDILLSGSAQFGLASPDQLLADRSNGKQVRAVAVDYRRSPRVYIALSSSGITRPQDFVGKTISVNRGGTPALVTMMKNVGIQPSQYSVVQSTSDLAPFYSGEVQVRSVYLNNEVLAIQAAGQKINIIYPDDYGIHFYSDVLVATDDLIATQPDLVLRFVRATLKGWTFAVEHPAEIGAMVAKYNPKANVALENDKMIASLTLVNTGEDQIGWMKPEIWSGMEQTLREQGALTAPLDVTQAYTMQFLEEIYK